MKLAAPFVLFLCLFSTFSSEAQEAAPLRIGAILPFTGKQAKQGELARKGIELALSEFGDFDPEIIYEDSRSDTAEAVSAFAKLRAINNIDAALTMGSPAGMALLPLANRDKVILLAMVVVSTFSVPDDFGFRLMGTAEGFGRRIKELLNELGKKRVALLYVEDDYGTTYAKFFESALPAESLAAKESYLPSTTDFRSLLLKLKQAKPEAVILASWGVEAGTIVRQAKEIRLMPDLFICPSACDNPDIAVSAGDAGASLIIVASASKTTAERKRILAERFQEVPTSVVLRFYDAIAVLRSAAKSCADKKERSDCLKQALAGAHDVSGSSYPVNFDKNGDIVDSYQLKIVRDGKLIELEQAVIAGKTISGG